MTIYYEIVDEDEDEDEDMVTHRANASICNTDSGVIFEGSIIISNIQELILEHGELQYKTRVSRSQKLLNPNTTMELLCASIQRCENEDVKQFVGAFEQLLVIIKSPLCIF